LKSAVILSWDPHGLADFIERHARRAEIVGDIPLDSAGKPLGSVATARYAVVPAGRRAVVIRDLLDAVRSVRPTCGRAATSPRRRSVPMQWLPPRCPRAEELSTLSAIAQPLVVALASQVPYLKSIRVPRAVPLPSRGRSRTRIATPRCARRSPARLTQSDVDAELAVLAPLFEEHDPRWCGRVNSLSAVSHLLSANHRRRVAPIGWRRSS